MPVHFHPATKSYELDESYRRHPRVMFSIPITVRHLCRGGVQSAHGFSLDLGEGGLGAIVQGEVRIGETVAIDFRLSDQPVTAVAIVRHSSNIRSGFEFVGLTPEERLLISTAVGHS
jgi:hypothetical protein